MIIDRTITSRRQGESGNDYLWRLGSLKEAGLLDLSWPQLTMILNTEMPNLTKPMDESTWRKRYAQLKLVNSASAPDVTTEDLYAASDNHDTTPDFSDHVNQYDPEKEKWRIRDERYALNRLIRSDARSDAVLDLFKEEITRFDSHEPPKLRVEKDQNETAIYALLSDIHYGIAFQSSAGDYDSEIAFKRVMNYAKEIIRIGEMSGANDCYVSLLGDMVSGIIHAPIRIENRENAVEQVIGVSELVACFLYALSESFAHVYVNSVSGNHSRLDLIAENALRAEKLDALIPWYCKAKLENVNNVMFFDNHIDPTVCDFDILDHYFVGVHGDMDKDLSKSASRLEYLAGRRVDYMIAGHLHVPNVLIEDRGYIRNGSVCGSGDDYTMKNRLFSNPSQVCMTVTKDGVKSIWPVAL